MIARKEIQKLKFKVFSPEQVRQVAVCTIEVPDTYNEDGLPIKNGLMDMRMGVIDPGLRCKTCGGKIKGCKGHFGKIELIRPIVHVGYSKKVYQILSSTCRKCGRFMLSDDEISTYREKVEKMGFIYGPIVEKEAFQKARNKKACPHCNERQGEIKWEKPYYYFEDRRRLWPTEIRNRFELILNSDLFLMGLDVESARPEWFVLQVLPVAPITVRPSITLESGDRSEDDLTHKLGDIVRINQRLYENIEGGAPQLSIEDTWDLLQYHIATYFDNEITGIPPARHRSGRPLKTVTQRLKGKEGRFRHNLSGKRVNFSARTPISPDANLSLNEVGVPYQVASELSIPERVTKYNKDAIIKLIKNVPNYPSAKYVFKAKDRRIRILEENKDTVIENLEEGDLIERHLIDGDYVIFNRQPSLHRMSMMGHRVKVLPYKTFRINTTVTTPYNADFDGDEMNLHVPQNPEAAAEVEELMDAKNSILSTRFGGPIIGGKHDHVSGMFLLTRDGVELTKDQAELLIGLAKLEDYADRLDWSKDKFTGKEIFSMILPQGFSVTYRNRLEKYVRLIPDEEKKLKKSIDNQATVEIKEGKLLKGVVDAEGVSGVLLQKLATAYGNEIGRQFIDNCARLGARAITFFGFTSSIADSDLPEPASKEIRKNLDSAVKEVGELIEKYNKKQLDPIPGKTPAESLENYIMGILGASRDKSGEIAGKYLGLDNHAVVMARSGARGSMLNLTQITGAVGQQAVRGNRIGRGFINRTTSHFQKGELTPESRGFVRNCFKSGLTPTEFFFHAMGGREGLVDTAIRTARSGYLQRRLINALQDLIVHDNLTVKDSGGVIVQFKYGEDGCDVSRTYDGAIPILEEEIAVSKKKEHEKQEEFDDEVGMIDYEEFGSE
jgi:DNA-directed RNA polymerase subunit A'